MDATRWWMKFTTVARFADSLAGWSTCKRANVSAIVTSFDFSTIHAIGYNGRPRGADNDSCRNVEGGCGCIHAESNAIAKLDSVRVRRALMYSTTAPCELCAGLIVNCGAISAVIYRDEYRRTEGLEILRGANICVFSMAQILKDIEHGDVSKFRLLSGACL